MQSVSYLKEILSQIATKEHLSMPKIIFLNLPVSYLTFISWKRTWVSSAFKGSYPTSSTKRIFGFDVSVFKPKKEDGNTNTWKIKVFTKPEQKNYPSQKINIDIYHLPSRDKRYTKSSDYFSFGRTKISCYWRSLC